MPLEIITMLGSTLLAGGMKLWSMKMQQQAQQQQALIERAQVRRKAVKEAREVQNEGFTFTRRVIAISVVFAVIIFPLVVAPLMDIQITHGWTEWNGGFLFFTDGRDVMEWKEAVGLVITPLHTNLVAAISGLYFGGSIVGHR